MRGSPAARKKTGDSSAASTEEEDRSEPSSRLLSHSARWRPKSRLADRPRIAFRRILLDRAGNCRTLPYQHKHQILRRKMFLNHLLRHLRRHRIDARLQLVDLIVAQSVKFVHRNNLRKLLGSLDIRRKLPFDVTLRRFQLLRRHALFV